MSLVAPFLGHGVVIACEGDLHCFILYHMSDSTELQTVLSWCSD